MRKLFVAILLMLVPMLAFGLGIRLGDIGQGEAPSLHLFSDVPVVDKDMKVAFGFASLNDENQYMPVWDLTASTAGGFFGRFGTDMEWHPFYGFGLNYPVTDAVGVEAFYGFGFNKHEDELEYAEARPGALFLNIWAEF